MSDSPSAETRPRLSEHSPSPSAAPLPPPLDAFKRHDEFWIDDGNLILVANQDTAFRVYRGLLAAQSTVFASMLAAASSDPAHLVDGCLVLEVSDTPEELAYFLRVLLPKSEPVFHHPPPSDPLLTFDHIAAVIRLAHKYNVKDAESQGIALLQESQFPVHYITWQERDMHPTIVAQKTNAIGALNLARLTGAVALLPMAVYGCIELGSAVVDGWERDDGVVEHLAPEDLKFCMDVRDALARKAAAAFGRVFKAKLCESCTTENECLSHLRAARRDIFREYFAGHLALDSWAPDLESLLDEYGLCYGCSTAVDDWDQDERNKIWEALPKMLGIEVEGWGEEFGCSI